MTIATRIMPMLSAADLTRSLSFYRDGLGGELVYRFPDSGTPDFVTLRFGETEMGIGRMADKPLHGLAQRPASGHRIELCVNVPGVDAAVQKLALSGAAVVMPPADQPWGERAAYVEDPDGNLVLLVAPISAA